MPDATPSPPPPGAPEPLEALLDDYVDDRLDSGARAEFERALERSPHLRRQLDLHRSVEDALRRTLAPPGDSALRAIADAARARLAAEDGRAAGAAAMMRPAPAGRPTLRRRPAFRRPLALAASIALAAAGLWLIVDTLRPAGPPDPYASLPEQSMEEVFQDAVADGLKPGWVCENDAEFAETFQQYLGQPLVLGPLPATIEALGLGRSNSLSPRTIELLARFKGEPVIVFIDRRDALAGAPISTDPDLNTYRSEVGDLVLIERSHLPGPKVLKYFHQPDGRTQS